MFIKFELFTSIILWLHIPFKVFGIWFLFFLFNTLFDELENLMVWLVGLVCFSIKIANKLNIYSVFWRMCCQNIFNTSSEFYYFWDFVCCIYSIFHIILFFSHNKKNFSFDILITQFAINFFSYFLLENFSFLHLHILVNGYLFGQRWQITLFTAVWKIICK